MKSIVYYHPRAIKKQPDRGSDLRVASMLEAFLELDYNVILISGDSRSRHQKIRELKKNIKNGLRIEYVYGESTNAPIIFADKNLIPANFLVDYAFMCWLKKQNIPTGIFIRDAHWRFDFFKKQLFWPLSIILKPLYHLDWYIYYKYSTVIFLPSISMNQYLPQQREQHTIDQLPPGFDTQKKPRAPVDTTRKSPLKLLYVGGIEPTIYDISELLKAVGDRENLQLTLCCRKAEWEVYGHRYRDHIRDNTYLVHANATQLERYYHEADVFLMLMNYSEYMDFAMPVKLFESIGYAVPIVSLNQKEVANYIKSTGIGWVIENFKELAPLLDSIDLNRSELANKQNKLMRHRNECTWHSRVIQADHRLLQARQKPEENPTIKTQGR